MNTEKKILALLESISDRAPADVVSMARNDVGYGEYGLALENLCEQIFEHSVLLSDQELAIVADLARQMKLPESRWTFIKTVAASDTPADSCTGEPVDGTTPRSDAELQAAATEIRETQAVDQIVPTLTTHIGMPPTAVALTRFIRMVAPTVPFEVANDVRIALEAPSDAGLATDLLQPWF